MEYLVIGVIGFFIATLLYSGYDAAQFDSEK